MEVAAIFLLTVIRLELSYIVKIYVGAWKMHTSVYPEKIGIVEIL